MADLSQIPTRKLIAMAVGMYFNILAKNLKKVKWPETKGKTITIRRRNKFKIQREE